MATQASKKEKDPVNIVHQNAILCETIMKEQRHQKLYTSYSVNPYNKMYTLSGKPNSVHDSEDGEADETFLKIFRSAQETPKQKYEFPKTEAQEIGWDTTPLVNPRRDDRRLNWPRKNSEITKYMDAAWKLKEQTENLN
ncbi:cilia- and flagella-associated protein 144-like [Corticium candelabrum]|uniref:cilia- and flagella-associated protein 144-like n=1 Tax=Corticium candelabrum TaxID=121492 RepID=UPI002E261ECD|nr:cilia- and flagella-associated protein 144-like [Corticium candelabrum]